MKWKPQKSIMNKLLLAANRCVMSEMCIFRTKTKLNDLNMENRLCFLLLRDIFSVGDGVLVRSNFWDDLV
jgi:hypothetical protein